MEVFVKGVRDGALLGGRATEGSVGYDLRSIDSVSIDPWKRVKIPIGLAVSMPHGVYGRISPRSSLALKGIDIGGGVIDQDYRGEISVILINNSDDAYVVSPGDKIAQLIFEVVATPKILVVDDGDLDATERGSGGFGSSGK